MTKRKPDKVIEYRISLQDKQAEQLESVIIAYQFRQFITPLVDILKDNTAMALILTAIAGYLGFNWVAGKYEDTMGMFDDFKTQFIQSPQYHEAGWKGFQEGIPLPSFLERALFKLITGVDPPGETGFREGGGL